MLFWGDWSPSLAATLTELPFPDLRAFPDFPISIPAPSAHPILLTPLPSFVFSRYHHSHSCDYDLSPSRISLTVPGLWLPHLCTQHQCRAICSVNEQESSRLLLPSRSHAGYHCGPSWGAIAWGWSHPFNDCRASVGNTSPGILPTAAPLSPRP